MMNINKIKKMTKKQREKEILKLIKNIKVEIFNKARLGVYDTSYLYWENYTFLSLSDEEKDKVKEYFKDLGYTWVERLEKKDEYRQWFRLY